MFPTTFHFLSNNSMTKKTIAAFTLIELLVVITIIAILAGIALPVFTTVQERGSQTKALAQGKQIGLALKLFASDNDGNFPHGVTSATPPEPDFSASYVLANSNIALKQLIPNYVPNEKIFYVQKSQWTPNPPDEVISTDSAKLSVGENHWAYVPRLTDTSNPNFPLIADGFSTSVGTYAASQAAKGGVWKGKKAVIIRADQSGSVEKLDTTMKALDRIGGATKEDIFSTSSNSSNWIPVAPVNPL